jgi:hypothetical protein
VVTAALVELICRRRLAYQGKHLHFDWKPEFSIAFDAKTGKQTYKTRIDPAATTFTTSPWAYNGQICFV